MDKTIDVFINAAVILVFTVIYISFLLASRNRHTQPTINMKRALVLLVVLIAEFMSTSSVSAADLNEAIIKRDRVIILTASIGTIVLLFFLLVILLNNRKLKQAKAELENFNQLRQAFIDADDDIVYLKDENLKYMFVNKAFEGFYQKKANEVIGLDDYKLTDDAFSQKRRETDLAVLEKESLVIDEVAWDGRVFKVTKFPVKMLNGKHGVGAYIRDITEDQERGKALHRLMYRHKILADLSSISFRSIQEELDYVLHQSLQLTESQYGYIYLYDEEIHEFTLNSWTNGVMQDCTVTDKQTKYQLEKTGIWGEVVRQRKPIVVNDFEQTNPLKKGFPQGHVPLKKYMSIPVIVDEKIVAVVGMANNSSGYDDNDVLEMTILMNGVWNALTRKEIQASLFIERNKYLQTLISIGDGILIVDKIGTIEMINTVAESLTGWKLEEAIGRHYTEVFKLSTEFEGHTTNDPIAGVLATDIQKELGIQAILTSKDGATYYIEDSAAPIKDNLGVLQGVVLVFRDVTNKMEQSKQIEYLSFHDSLTGLYNRRFFEEEIQRLDTKRNLPISIIVGDVNSLKLTNDVFGHFMGDELLRRVAEVLKNTCRADDIIARWGGDEFVILLPKTGADEAEGIVGRIRDGFSKEKIKAIKGSISMGFDTKHDLTEEVSHVLLRAEEKMYLAKTLERDEVRSGVVKDIIETLHEHGPAEKDHSDIVSEMCQKLGRELNLDENEIRKLKEAGYLHDIGKIVLDPKLLDKNYNFTVKEKDEIKRHTTVGYRILSSFDNTMDLAESVLAHHEHWDGSGYPKGWKGEQIPIISRIIAIVETYERVLNRGELLLTEREQIAADVISKGAGSQFDPRIAEMFVQVLDKKSR